MKNNEYLLKNTIYETDLNFVYQYGYVHPVLPIRFEKIGYVLGLPRILRADQTRLYFIKSNAIINGNKLYKNDLLLYVIYVNNTLKEVSQQKYDNL